MQDALHSELERGANKTVMLICAHDISESEFSDRVFEGLPQKTITQSLVFSPISDLRQLSNTAVLPNDTPDVLLAYGSARAIELARKCRYAFTKANGKRPELYAIPGVDGLPEPCTRNLESWRAGLPSVLICDPTLTLNAEDGQSWRSSVLSLVRCVESYLEQSFNPPADGMALEAFGRSLETLSRIGRGSPDAKLELHRDMMAASLNASMSQEKGVGPALTLAHTLAADHVGLDVSDVSRLLLPLLIRQRKIDPDRINMLLKVLDNKKSALATAMERVLAQAPLPARLSDMGVKKPALKHAARQADSKAGLTFESAVEVLEAAF